VRIPVSRRHAMACMTALVGSMPLAACSIVPAYRMPGSKRTYRSVSYGHKVVGCWPVAADVAQQMAGLSGAKRPTLPLVFALDAPQVDALWTKGVRAAVSAAWVNPHHRVVGYWTAPVGSDATHTSPEPVTLVIESPVGRRILPRRRDPVRLGRPCQGNGSL